MPGHLFITQGSLPHLACDAWLLSTSGSMNITGNWWSALSPTESQLVRAACERRTAAWGRAFRVAPVVEDWIREPGSRAFLADVGGVAGTEAEWYLAGACEFLDRVQEKLQSMAPLHRRAKHLVALPVIGTGAGGAREVKGTIVNQLVPLLHEEARQRDLDIALVAFSRPMFAAAQKARRDRYGVNAGSPAWPELPRDLYARAHSLADRSRVGGLVLFLGAGASAGAGLPTWDRLLAGLARRAGLDDDEWNAVAQMDALDQATILRKRLEPRGLSLGLEIASELRADRYSLGQSLLASVPIRETVTTNYDQLFELASKDAEMPTSVLPYAIDRAKSRWLLKLHGCVSHPDDIVLTRTDYMRYEERRAALGGILQAMLITRHMLFVGFSLSDDNFHRIADEVRRAVTGVTNGDTKFGTALILKPRPHLEDLWQGEIEWVRLAGSAASETATAARRHDIFLDLLSSLANDGAVPLMDVRYDGVLSAGKRELRDSLTAMTHRLTGGARATTAWTRIDELLRDLGAPPTDPGPSFKDHQRPTARREEP